MILLKSFAQGMSHFTGVSIPPTMEEAEVQSSDLARKSSERKGEKKARSINNKQGFFLGFLILWVVYAKIKTKRRIVANLKHI